MLSIGDGARIGDIKKGLVAAAERAGVEGVTPHVLKHTRSLGPCRTAPTCGRRLGLFATSAPTLIRVYGHHHPDFMRGAAEAIGRRPGGSRMGR